MRVKFQKTSFGYTQDCELEITNEHDGVHIRVIEAEYPNLIGGNVIDQLVNRHRGAHDAWVGNKRQRKEAANSGFLHEKIKYLEDELEKAKFAQKIARRNKIFVDGREV